MTKGSCKPFSRRRLHRGSRPSTEARGASFWRAGQGRCPSGNHQLSQLFECKCTSPACRRVVLDNDARIRYTGCRTETGAVAQLGARINRTDEARGSNPLSSTSQYT